MIRVIQASVLKAQTVAKLPQSKFASHENRNACFYLTRSLLSRAAEAVVCSPRGANSDITLRWLVLALLLRFDRQTHGGELVYGTESITLLLAALVIFHVLGVRLFPQQVLNAEERLQSVLPERRAHAQQKCHDRPPQQHL